MSKLATAADNLIGVTEKTKIKAHPRKTKTGVTLVRAHDDRRPAAQENPKDMWRRMYGSTPFSIKNPEHVLNAIKIATNSVAMASHGWRYQDVDQSMPLEGSFEIVSKVPDGYVSKAEVESYFKQAVPPKLFKALSFSDENDNFEGAPKSELTWVSVYYNMR